MLSGGIAQKTVPSYSDNRTQIFTGLSGKFLDLYPRYADFSRTPGALHRCVARFTTFHEDLPRLSLSCFSQEVNTLACSTHHLWTSGRVEGKDHGIRDFFIILMIEFFLWPL
jgi:hypothetical protein